MVGGLPDGACVQSAEEEKISYQGKMSSGTENTTGLKANSFVKGMNKDVADLYMSDQAWTHAINAINNSHLGDTGTLSNEPANYNAANAPYVIIGAIHKKDTEWIIFSTNNTHSEIGIFNEQSELYTSLVNDDCLGFKTTNLISGACKSNYDCTYSVYWQDNLNPDRTLNLENIPYKTTGANLSTDPDCFVPEYTNALDCDALRLHPLVKQPCVTIRKAQGGGQLNNGSYMAVVAYSENGIRLTDYSIPSAPQPLWNHTGIGGSLDITVSQLDQDFEEYELVMIAVINEQTIVKKIGNYPIRQTVVHLDIYGQDLENIPVNRIPMRSVVYEKSQLMTSLGGYLIRSGVTSQPYFNYQQAANKIVTNWAAVEYSRDFYWNGGNLTGYLRDEVYAFFIRWVYNTGARSASYHIPGRESTPGDRAAVSGSDVVYSNETERWQVYDTSSIQPTTGTAAENGVVVAKGQMSFWESTERYPDDQPDVWGDLCGKKIRHHKMPSNETTHIHNSQGDKIYILGVQFSNISHPVDDVGNPITSIVGYEIMRGSREGNRTIVAKGMFNNMWEYDLKGNTTKKGLYQNYPYNDLRPDKFHVTGYSTLDSGTGNNGDIESTTALSSYKRNYFSFHSPETSFIKPYLGSNYVKIYTEERGTVRGNFELPYKHPRHKILTDTAFGTAAVVGLGIAVLAAVGKTTTSGYRDNTDTIWTAPYGIGNANTNTIFHQESARESSVGTIIEDLIAGTVIDTVGTGTAAAGVITLAAEATYFMGTAMDQVLTAIYNIAKFRHFELQYNSHGFYSNYSTVTNSSAPAGYAPSFRRLIKTNGTKYIGSGLQDFDATYRINNLNRNKYVAIGLTADLPNPTSTVDATRQRVKDGPGGISHSSPFNEFDSTTVAYYGAIKVDFQNQYGQLSAITQLPTDSCVFKSSPTAMSSTGVIFGGDVYINRFTEKNPYFFYNTWLLGEPDGTELDYRNHVNGPAPRYWVDFNRYDMTDFDVSITHNPWPHLHFTVPSSFHRLDRPNSVTGILGSGVFALRNTWMYLFYNGVRDFFTESELNMAYRDYGENDYQKFYDVYGSSFNDLSTMFRSDLIKEPTYYKYDISLTRSKLFSNFATWGQVLPNDYDPKLYSTCFEYYPKRSVYSLQQQSGMRRDNWRNYLPLNYKDFTGKVSAIKSLNVTGAVILFEDAEPVQFKGVDELQTAGGVKITIGDGGLFAQNMQSMVNADDLLEYGSCTASRSAVNTPYGMFWISQKTGKIMQYGGSISEISRDGLKFWFTENLPSKMLAQYPDYPLYDNPVAGIGCQTVYDQQYEMLYFSKKDYAPKRNDLMFDDPSGVPYYICGQINPPPLDPIAPVIHDKTGGVAHTDTSCTVPIDLAIVLDVTGSMGGVITNLKSSIPTIVTDIIAASGNDYRLALVSVDEVSGGFADHGGTSSSPFTDYVQVLCSFATNNNGTFNTALTPVITGPGWGPSGLYGGGGSGPEPTDLGIKRVLDGDCGALRPEAAKIIIMITDALPSGGNDNYNPAVDPINVQNIADQAAAASTRIYTIRTGGGVSNTTIGTIHGMYNSTTGGANYDAASGVVGPIVSEIISGLCPPSCYFTADTYSITEGDEVNLVWDTINATTVEIAGLGTVAATGSATVHPLTTTTYYLTVSDSTEQTSTCSVTINVKSRAPIPKKCPCTYDNPDCFTPCNWTASYDPKAKIWVSFHDWTPDLTIPAYQHFFTTKGSGIWKHNTRWDLYANYYGKDYPWEVEFNVTNPSQVTTLRSIEYWMEAYKYYNDGKDFNHVLDVNFDTAIIHNSEQMSGILKMQVKAKNNPLQLIAQPVITPYQMEILVAKEENKYRFNTFWDNTNDRGEFTLNETPMWITDCNGYRRTVNPEYINYNKPALQRKKFRHFGNKIVLRKTVSGDKKMILKLEVSKHLNSPR
jgi:hypothetical protein